MPGKVFISCGQKSEGERKIAEEIKDLLNQEFSLNPYLAFKIQSLDDIMTITNELRTSDYFIFIDFKRNPDKSQAMPISLFSHQELALAHHLGFKDMIALQQTGVPLEGFLRYVLSNPEHFNNKKDLPEMIRRIVKERGWSPFYSRNLVVNKYGFSDPIKYRDHSGIFIERVYKVKVENRRPDTSAVESVCILDHIKKSDGTKIKLTDRSYLKWAGQAGYKRTILPQGIFLHSLSDTCRDPILIDDGDYELFYKLFSQGYPLVEFSIKLNLQWCPPSETEWTNKSHATLV